MKSALFRKDNYGAVVGRLIAPNILTYEATDSNGGAIMKNIELTGNIVETASYDVIVIGRKMNEDATIMEVTQMEDLVTGDNVKIYHENSTSDPFSILVIPLFRMQKIEKRLSLNNKPYNEIKISFNSHTTLYVDVYGDTLVPEEERPLVFLSKGIQEAENDYSNKNNAYSCKKWNFKRAVMCLQIKT